MSRTNVDAFEDGLEVANDGDVFVRDKTHANGGYWQAAGAAAQAFPVGSVYENVLDATNPATLLGYGTWVALGAGRVLVGIDAGDTDFDTVGETGGAKTKTISAHAGTAVGDHANHAHGYGTLAPSVHTATTVGNHVVTQPINHVVTQPSAHSPHGHDNGTLAVSNHTSVSLSHNHEFSTGSIISSGDIGDKVGTGVKVTGTTDSDGPGTQSHTLSGTIATSASLTHSGTAVDAHSGTTVDAHAVTGPGNHTMSGNTSSEALSAHSVTQPSAHSALNVVQPYIVVHRWYRSA